VVNNELVIEAKGIYSVEKFLISRRLMYWQVYLHKTVIAADQLLLNILRRAKLLIAGGIPLTASPALQLFLTNRFVLADFDRPEILDAFALLDDSDIDCAIKGWCKADDKILSELCRMMVARRLFKIEINAQPFDETYIEEIKMRVQQHFSYTPEALPYFVVNDTIINKGYDDRTGKIQIRFGKSELRDIYDVSDMLSAQAFSGVTKKYFLCYPKQINK
jgi:HD superfamily phosphohydrolase